MGFYSGFKGLTSSILRIYVTLKGTNVKPPADGTEM